MPKKKAEIVDIALFCPSCGQPLVKSKFEDEGGLIKDCSNNHIWEIRNKMDTHGSMIIIPVRLVRCPDCGGQYPYWYMSSKVWAETSVSKEVSQICRNCLEKERQTWQMDKEKSYARLKVTPIRTTDSIYYSLDTEIKVEPYPNPFSWGGMYGGGGAKSKEALEDYIANFKVQAGKLKDNGLEKIEVITNPEVVRSEQRSLEKKTVGQATAKLYPKHETIQPEIETPEVKQLSLVF